MRKTHLIALGALSMFNVSAQAAATLFTPPLLPVSPDEFNCAAANVSKKGSLEVELTIYSKNGIDQGPQKSSLRPGEMANLSAPGGLSLYCKFRVLNGSSRDIRGLASIYQFNSSDNTSGSDKVVVPAN